MHVFFRFSSAFPSLSSPATAFVALLLHSSPSAAPLVLTPVRVCGRGVFVRTCTFRVFGGFCASVRLFSQIWSKNYFKYN